MSSSKKQKRWRRLYEHANFAEGYVYTDPSSAATKLRLFSEEIVGILSKKFKIPFENNDGLLEKIDKLKSQIPADQKIWNKLHTIRSDSNDATHVTGKKVTTKTALARLKDAYEIGQWLVEKFSDSENTTFPKFTPPRQPDKEELHQTGIYADGHGARQNNQLAANKSYHQSAKQFDAEVQNDLGSMYEKGQGVKQDDQQALRCYRQSAELSLAEAKNNLGSMYDKDQGIKQDDQQALQSLPPTAEQGSDAEAQFNLGWMYAKGQGVEQSDEQAVDYFSPSGSTGSCKSAISPRLDVCQGSRGQTKSSTGVSVVSSGS